MRDSNIGIVGPESVRLNGAKIENLPIGEAARVAPQMEEVRKADRKSKADAVRARYPKQNVGYLVGRIAEARSNIARIKQFAAGQQQKANEYRMMIGQCEAREKMEADIAADDPDREQKLADLRKQFLPYNTEALQQQISQFEEAVRRSDDVIEQENESILQLTETLALCRRRDQELRNLGE